MIATDEDALICDLAETYHIFDYKSLPVLTVATLSVGLRTNSRIKMRLAGAKYPLDTILLATVADKLSNLVWMQSEDGAKGINCPKSILASLLEDVEESNVEAFDTPEDFEQAWKAMTEGRDE